MKNLCLLCIAASFLLFSCDPIVQLCVENKTDSVVHLEGVLQPGNGFDPLGLSAKDMSTTSLVTDSLPTGEKTVAYDLLPGQVFPIGEQIGLEPGTDFQYLFLSWKPTPTQDSLPPVEIRLSSPKAILSASQELEKGIWAISLRNQHD